MGLDLVGVNYIKLSQCGGEIVGCELAMGQNRSYRRLPYVGSKYQSEYIVDKPAYLSRKSLSTVAEMSRRGFPIASTIPSLWKEVQC